MANTSLSVQDRREAGLADREDSAETDRSGSAVVVRRSATSAGGAVGVNGAKPWYRSTLVGLAVVLGLIAGGGYLLRRVLPNVQRGSGADVVEVLARTYLSPKQSLCLLRCGHHLVLIGVTPERICRLAVLDDPTEVSQLVSAVQSRKAGSITAGFGQLLERAAEQMAGPGRLVPEPAGADERQVRMTGQQLRGLLKKVQTYAAGRRG